MDTARAWKLGVGIATLMLIAVTAALVAAKGTLGFADWPAVANAPAPKETVVLVEPDPPVVPVRGPQQTEPAAPLTRADEVPEPVTVVRGAESERPAPREPRVEPAPEPPAEEAEQPAPVEVGPDPLARGDAPLARPADAAIPVAAGHE